MRTNALPRRGLPCALLVAVLGSSSAPVTVAAQSTLLVESRAGLATPTGGFRSPLSETNMASAPAVGLHFGLRRGERTYVFVGFSQLRFDCEGGGCEGSWIATQWEAGVRTELTTGPVVPWIRAGLVSPSVEHVPGVRRGARGWGGEGGVGVRFALTERLSLSPGARYGAVGLGRSRLDDVSMRYLIFDLGLVVGF